jgi:hypothetical protein
MRHPETYLGLPMPDPTSSESGKGTWGSPAPTLGLIGSGSRLRASQHDCSTTTRSLSGERRPPASRHATAPLLRSIATPTASLARSLARVETEAGKQMTLGFCGEPAAQHFWCAKSHVWPSIADGRHAAFWAGWCPVGRWDMRPRPSLPYEFLHVGWADTNLASGPVTN